MAWGFARELVRSARALEHMPRTAEAIESGDVSMSGMRVLVDAREADPEAFQGFEDELVETARMHSVDDLRRVAAYWKQAVEREAAPAGEERQSLHASATFMGRVRMDGDLNPETGETVVTALRAVMDAEARSGVEDDRLPAQRRADALGEICRQWLDRLDRPAVGGERPHVTLTVDVETLRGLSGTRELEHTGPVSRATAERILCDASISRVVMRGRSEPLDVGRRTPVVSAALRRAVIARDEHCRFPGCERPAGWCDVHHVVPWDQGGPTCLANLVLLCRRHHGLLHRRSGFRLKIEDGSPVFRRPDGSILEERAPPPR
jgi:hypothetical protein